MKKTMKRLALCLLAALMLLGTLASCVQRKSEAKDPLPFEEVYQSSFTMPFQKPYTTSTPLDLDYTVTSGGCILVYRAEEQYCFYNVDTAQVVLKIDKNKIASTSTDISFSDGDENYIQIVETHPETKAKSTLIYSERGKLLASAEGSLPLTTFANGIVLDEKLYYIENDEVKKEINLPPFADSATTYSFINGLIVSITQRAVTYYDDDLKITARYEIPGHAFRSTVHSLSDGKILAQYITLCDMTSKKYDYMDSDGKKYTIHRELFDPATGKIEKQDTNGIIFNQILNKEKNSMLGFRFEDIYTDKVENVLTYSTIVDGVVDYSVQHVALLGNDGQIGASLEYVENQTDPIIPLNTGYYCAPTKTGYTILNTKGEAVYEVPTIENATDFGYVNALGTKIYDSNFELALNLSDKGYKILSIANDLAVFYLHKPDTGGTHYYRYDKNGAAEITPPEGRIFKNGYSTVQIYQNTGYYVTEHYDASTESPFSSEPSYSFYGLNGDLLFTTKDPNPQIIADGENAMVVKYLSAKTGTNLYLRITKG